MIKSLKWWHIETILDISALGLALFTGNWGFCAMYFAVAYFAQKAIHYMENN